MLSADVLGTNKSTETGPPDTTGSTETTVHAAKANGVRKRENIVQLKIDDWAVNKKAASRISEVIDIYPVVSA